MQYLEARSNELVLEMGDSEREAMLLLFGLVFNGNCTVRSVQQARELSALANLCSFYVFFCVLFISFLETSISRACE